MKGRKDEIELPKLEKCGNLAEAELHPEQNVESVAFVMGKDRRDEYIAKIDSLHLYHWNHVKPVEVKVRSLTNLNVL